MNLVRLIYASRFCESKFDSQELAKILESSQKNNALSEITGSLVFCDDIFLQCLEGEREVVSKLFNKISNDPRHDSVTILGMEDLSERDFAEWKMRFALLTEANAELIKKYSASSKFNPFRMQYKNALELLKALRK